MSTEVAPRALPDRPYLDAARRRSAWTGAAARGRWPTVADEITIFDQWCIVELFGHQRYAGRVRQADWPPGFARLEIPATPGHEAVTQLLSPQSIYRLTPTTEAIATAVAAQCRPEPVHRWELPEAKSAETWEGADDGADPDPDYGKDLDDEDDYDEEGPF